MVHIGQVGHMGWTSLMRHICQKSQISLIGQMSQMVKTNQKSQKCKMGKISQIDQMIKYGSEDPEVWEESDVSGGAGYGVCWSYELDKVWFSHDKAK